MSGKPFEVQWVPSPHPSRLPPDLLARQCDMKMTRGSGPGGQHRNKTSTAVVLCHLPTGVTAEASERRSQIENRKVAFSRLRTRLAVLIRCDETTEEESSPFSASTLRQQYRGRTIWVAKTNPDRPVILSLLLDDLFANQGETKGVAKNWGTTNSQVLRLLRSCPPALEALNRIREHYDKYPLK